MTRAAKYFKNTDFDKYRASIVQYAHQVIHKRQYFTTTLACDIRNSCGDEIAENLDDCMAGKLPIDSTEVGNAML